MFSSILNFLKLFLNKHSKIIIMVVLNLMFSMVSYVMFNNFDIFNLKKMEDMQREINNLQVKLKEIEEVNNLKNEQKSDESRRNVACVFLGFSFIFMSLIFYNIFKDSNNFNNDVGDEISSLRKMLESNNINYIQYLIYMSKKLSSLEFKSIYTINFITRRFRQLFKYIDESENNDSSMFEENE